MPVPAPRRGTAPAVGGAPTGLSSRPAAERPMLPRQAGEAAGGAALTLLVIEDDPAGTFTVPEMLDSAGKRVRIRTARNLTEAERLLTDDVHCILLDLALPGPGCESADELDILRHVLRIAPRHAVLALTAEAD